MELETTLGQVNTVTDIVLTQAGNQQTVQTYIDLVGQCFQFAGGQLFKFVSGVVEPLDASFIFLQKPRGLWVGFQQFEIDDQIVELVNGILFLGSFSYKGYFKA